MKRQYWMGVGALILAAPMAAGISGCNGDNDSGGPAVPTATPTETAAQNISAPINLGNGKSGLLTLRVQGSRATGSLKVSNSTATVRASQANAITFNIPNGAYGVSGTFNPPRNFNVTGAFPAPVGAFTITGTLPTASQAGSFLVRANGQTASATIPALGPIATPTGPGATATPTDPNATPTATSAGATPTATATSQPGATATPTPGGGSTATNLVFTRGAGYNGLSTPFTRVESVPTASVTNIGGGLLAAVVSAGNATTGARSFNIRALRVGGPVVVGTTFQLGPTGSSEIRYNENRPASNDFRGTWSATGGTLQVSALTDNSITLRFNAVSFSPFSFGAENASGNFTLNGTLTFPISRAG